MFLEKLGVRAFDSFQRKLARRDAAAAEAWGARLGRLAQRVDRKHARRTLSNLELAFPDWSAEQRQVTANRMYEHFGRVFADFMQTPNVTREQVLANTEVNGLEHLEEALSYGKGVIVVTGHYGNWERMGHWVIASGRTLTVVARDANQSALNDRVMSIRNTAGFHTLSRGSAIRTILQKLKNNEAIALLCDQNDSEVFVPFFGKPAGMVLGPGKLHERTGAPVLPFYGTWLEPGKYRMDVHPILKPEPGFEVAEGLSRAICASLEAQVRQVPEQYLWMHDRWKSARQRGML